MIIQLQRAYYQATGVLYEPRAVAGWIELQIRLRAGDRDYVWQIARLPQSKAHLLERLIDTLIREGARAAAQGKPYAPAERAQQLLEEVQS